MAMMTAANPFMENTTALPRPNVQKPQPVTLPSGPTPTVPPGNTPPATQTQAPNMTEQSLAPTAQNPLTPMNNYQAQQQSGSYNAPTFQGQSNYQAGSYTAPNVAGSPYSPQTSGATYQAGNTQAPSVGAQNASAGQFDVTAFRPFADAVYSEATRQLDPQFQAREAQFRQQMVNQGIQEGTAAWDNAFANFDRSRNDAYGSARNQALAQALGAQNQFFGQNLANSQMGLQASMANANNALQAAGLNQADRQYGANLGLQYAGLNQADRQFGAGQGLQAALANAQMQMQAQQMGQQDRQFGAQMGLNYDQLINAFNQRNAEYGGNLGLQYAQMGQQDRQFGANYDFQQGRADMQDLMALLGYGNQTTQYNNQLLGQDQQRAGSLFNLIPGLTPPQLDVTGPMNSYMNAQQQAMANQTNQQNGFYNALGQIGAAAIPFFMPSDRRVKTDVSQVGTLDNGLPVYAYRYVWGGPMQIGVMAQDVEKVNPEAVAEFGGIKAVNYAEAVR